MKKWLQNGVFRMKHLVRNFLKEEAGEANIIAIILIIIVVIALVAIFRDQLTDIVNELFARIQQDLSGF